MIQCPSGGSVGFLSEGGFDMRRLLASLGICCTVAVLWAAPAPVEDAPKLLIVSNRTGNAEIFLVDADGGHPKNLTNNKDVNSYPAWSPDRKKIAFSSNRDGGMNIYVMEADGANVKALTKGNELCRAPS